MQYAVIDIGSNSVRLMFVADGKVLYKTLKTTRLGEGLAVSPYLREEAMARTALAVADFFYRAKDEGAEIVYAFATAAVRSAKNGADFVSLVKEKCGLSVEVVSGETEAEIGVLGALGEKDGAVVDVGGASTEIVVRKEGVFVYKKSVDVGVVRLKDLCGRNKDALQSIADEKASVFGEVPVNAAAAALSAVAGHVGAAVQLVRAGGEGLGRHKAPEAQGGVHHPATRRGGIDDAPGAQPVYLPGPELG